MRQLGWVNLCLESECQLTTYRWQHVVMLRSWVPVATSCHHCGEHPATYNRNCHACWLPAHLQQLSEFAEVLQVLRSDMGMQFEIFADTPSPGARRRRTPTSRSPSPSSSSSSSFASTSGRGRAASASKYAAPATTPPSPSASSSAAGQRAPDAVSGAGSGACRAAARGTGVRGIDAAMGSRGSQTTPTSSSEALRVGRTKGVDGAGAANSHAVVPGAEGAGTGVGAGPSKRAGSRVSRRVDKQAPEVGLGRSAPLPWQPHRQQQVEEEQASAQSESAGGMGRLQQQQRQQQQRQQQPREDEDVSLRSPRSPLPWQLPQQQQQQQQQKKLEVEPENGGTAPMSRGKSPMPWQQPQRQQPAESAAATSGQHARAQLPWQKARQQQKQQQPEVTRTTPTACSKTPLPWQQVYQQQLQPQPPHDDSLNAAPQPSMAPLGRWAQQQQQQKQGTQNASPLRTRQEAGNDAVAARGVNIAPAARKPWASASKVSMDGAQR